MTEYFTEVEQEEIINEFLNACGEKQEQEEQEEPEEDFKLQYDRLLSKAGEHIIHIKQIETKNYVPIKEAILKFMEQAQNGRNYLDEPYVYTRKLTWFKKLSAYTNLLNIHKKGTRFVCSKERLEQIDFKIIEQPSVLHIEICIIN